MVDRIHLLVISFSLFILFLPSYSEDKNFELGIGYGRNLTELKTEDSRMFYI